MIPVANQMWTALLNHFCRSLLHAREARLNQQLRANGSTGRVTSNVELRHPEHVFIGDNSYVNGGMLVASENAKIIIRRDCMLSYAVHLRTDMHRHDRLDMPMIEQGEDEADIIIEDDVWIGYGAQIMSGEIVGAHSIVGAGAVVTHDVPDYSVVGGPARLLHKREPYLAPSSAAVINSTIDVDAPVLDYEKGPESDQQEESDARLRDPPRGD